VKSDLYYNSPIDIICTIITSHRISHAIKNTIKIGGTRNTCGVPPKNYAVHFITAMPILIFFTLQIAQHNNIPVNAHTAYDPYK